MFAGISINVLCYGDHFDLAERCLGSISRALSSSSQHIRDVRIGMNEVAQRSDTYIRKWSEEITNQHELPVRLYTPDRNARKYPLMRRMFNDPAAPLPGWVMWFDDDSYLTDKGAYPHVAPYFDQLKKWCENRGTSAVMFGENWWERQLQGNQRDFFTSKPWWTHRGWKSKKGKNWVPFVQGGFWLLRTDVIRKYDWPMKELFHHGGDMALGMLLIQQGLSTDASDPSYVKVNADDRGRGSKALRRGPDQKDNLVGADYVAGKVGDLSHHEFDCRIEIVGKLSPTKPAMLKLSGL
jgi:hypothetical protein